MLFYLLEIDRANQRLMGQKTAMVPEMVVTPTKVIITRQLFLKGEIWEK